MTHVLHVSDPCATLAGRNPCTTWVLPMYYMGGQIPDVPGNLCRQTTSKTRQKRPEFPVLVLRTLKFSGLRGTG